MNTDDKTTQVAQTALADYPRPVATLDPAWSEQTLGRILSAPIHSPRRSRAHRLGAVALSIGALGMGGAAYAVGGAPLPGIFSRSIDDFADQMDSPKPDMVQVADLTLPDGSRFAAWHGINAQLECSASTADWDGKDALGWGWTTCQDITPGQTNLNRASVSWAGTRSNNSAGGGSSLYYPVLVGHTTSPETTKVVVTGSVSPAGETINETLTVDTATGSFAMVLPGSDPHPFQRSAQPGLTIRFLDADGAEVESPAHPTS